MRRFLIDTASSTLFIGLLDDDTIVASRSVDGGRAVTDLHGSIQEVLGQARLELREVDEFAVVRGPGNWTGVNVGVVTVKILCLALDRPMILLSRMQALIDSAPEAWDSGLAAIATGRSAYFLAHFDGGHHPRKTAGQESERIDVEDFRNKWADTGTDNLVTTYEDLPAIRSLEWLAHFDTVAISFERLLDTYLHQIASGTAERLTGEDVHLALPDYAGADKTIRTSPGSFR